MFFDALLGLSPSTPLDEKMKWKVDKKLSMINTLDIRLRVNTDWDLPAYRWAVV